MVLDWFGHCNHCDCRPKGKEGNMEKSILAMRQEKRTFNYIVLAMLVATIAVWIMWFPR